MVKSLSERIAARATTKKAQNRSAFLALREEINQAVLDGWSIKTIWETLQAEGKISFGYETFIKYVNSHIKTNLQSIIVPVPETITTNREQNKPKVSKHDIPGFNYEAIPSKKDLI